MTARQLPLPGEIVKKSNALMRARWSIESVWEPRLVALLASKVKQEDSDFHVYEIPVAEVMPERDRGGKDYREIENVVDRVMSRVLTIRDEDGWTKYNVFSRCRYRAKDGILELGFHPDLKPHYLNLQKNFAKYNLIEFLTLRSIYSQKLFELLKSWDEKPEITINLSELFDLLNVPESHKKDFAIFRRKVLEKAHTDINTKTELRFEWEPIKQGKAVVAIKFLFSKNFCDAAEKKRLLKAASSDSKKNNALFLAANACMKARGGTCDHPSPKRKQCALCLRLFQTSPKD